MDHQDVRNFQLIASGINVHPLLIALQQKGPEFWNRDKTRTTFPGTPHAQVDDILLRFEDTSNAPASFEVDELEEFVKTAPIIWRDAWKELPQARQLVLDLMRGVDAYQVMRVMITRVAPGKGILAHQDLECYAQLPDIARYHLVLQGLPGSLFRCGEETICMETGECWWFNAHEIHEVMNNSVDDRIHMLIDMRITP
jgi:hypothetical protein